MQLAAADEISDWNEQVVGFTVNRKMPPPVAERLIAMMQVASSLTVAAATAAASLLAPPTTALIDVPAPTIEVLT
jgi:hypothetical protein